MGIFISKCYTKHYDSPIELRSRILVLEEEIREWKRVREQETWAHEKQVEILECKEGEWKQQQRKHKEEVSKLKKRLKEEEEKMRSLEGGEGWMHWVGTEYLVEHMKEEQAQRSVAVEKWKQLYLTIKTELDDLILRTKQGGRLCTGAEEGMIQELHRELRAKEETIETLRSRVSTMEKEGVKKEREIDILRQSLRILSNTRRHGMRKNLRRRLLL